MSKVRKNDKIILKELSKFIPKKLNRGKNLKKTHYIFNENIYSLLKSKKITNFLRNSFIQKMFFVHNRFFIFQELKILKKNKKWNFYKNLLTEDNVGNPVRYFLYPKSSGNKINHVYHLSVLEKYLKINLKNIQNVFEFGGGYGCMARIFYQINKNIKYTIFDTKLVNLIQFYYLRHNKIDSGFKNYNRFTLKNDLKSLNFNNYKKSLFLANWSLSEVPILYREKFVKHMTRFKYVFIAFQEHFENINNLKYFMKLQKKFINEYDFYLTENQFYKGNILNKQKHYFLVGKKINK